MSDQAIKIKYLNIKREEQFQLPVKILARYTKKLSLKNLTISKNVCLIDVFATPKISQFSIAAISFVIACNELKITQIVQINQLF